MAISTTVTSSAPTFTNVAPIPFTITFSEVVTGLDLSDISISGGSGVRLTNLSAGAWLLEVNPSTQGGSVFVQVPASVVTGLAPDFDTNTISNGLTREFLSIRPLVNITHNIKPVTTLTKVPFVVTFDRDVTGLAANDFDLVNSVIYSITGSGSQYNVIVAPQKSAQFEFSVKDSACVDIYGNLSRQSSKYVFTFDNTDLDDKSNIVHGEIKDKELLRNFDVSQIKQVAAISTLADCAKNIPQRLLDVATQKAFDILRNNPDVKKLAAMVTMAQAAVELAQTITDNIKAIKKDPITFLGDVLAAQGLSGDALQAKIEGIIASYPGVSNINSLIEKAMTSGICGQPNFYADGSPAPKPAFVPTDVLPEKVPGVIAGVQNQQYDTSPKDNYDAFMYEIKDQLKIDTSLEQTADRAKMMSVLTTLVMGYHDRIAKTTDSSSDSAIHESYLKNAEAEAIKNAIWPDDIKASFKTKTYDCGILIQKNVEVIRIYFNRNLPASGKAVSVGITTYSGPDKDFTTFLDIKPDQRPPELVHYWENTRGFNIQKNEANLKSRGIKTGTLNFSDAYNGVYGPLQSDFTCASSRFPGDSVLLLKNPDGTIYNPTGRNASGLYKVMDTGNSALTYNKPDIFTNTPELYKNTASVQVSLVSLGNKTGPQYRLAQRKFGSSQA